MSVPILKLDEFLIASVQAALSDSGWEKFRQDILSKAGQFRSQGAVIDITVMDVVDSFASRTLAEMVAMLRLRGTESVIVGIQPEVAMAMAQLGLSLPGVPTALDLEEGMALLAQRVKERRAHA